MSGTTHVARVLLLMWHVCYIELQRNRRIFFVTTSKLFSILIVMHNLLYIPHVLVTYLQLLAWVCFQAWVLTWQVWVASSWPLARLSKGEGFYQSLLREQTLPEERR